MKRLTRFPLLAFFALISTVTLWAAVIKSIPTASPTMEGHVTVRWQTEDESDVSRFEVYRAQIVGGMTPGPGDFSKVSPNEGIPSKGNNQSYEFTDKSVFKSASNVFAYKVRVVFQNGTYSDSEITRTATTTNIGRRTWGSIKALFR